MGKQVHARKTKIPIDNLAFFTEPTDQRDVSLTKAPEDGVNVHGLFIQGCGWSMASSQMAESMKGVLFVELPIIWMQVIMEEEFYSLVDQTDALVDQNERRWTTAGHGRFHGQARPRLT